MTIYKVFDKDKQEYWSGRPVIEMQNSRAAKIFYTLSEVMCHLEDMRKGSSWSQRKPTPIPSSWVIVEYELKEVWTANAKEYSEAR